MKRRPEGGRPAALPRVEATSTGPVPHGNGGSVLEHHGGPRRDGVFVDPSLTRASASSFHLDPSFQASVDGAVYAQPLFLSEGPSGKPVLIVATEANEVAVLDAATGAPVWTRRLGSPVPLARLPCGNIDPLGITGTPIVDAAGRTLYVDAMVSPDGGTTKQHLVFALSVDDGSTRTGWPVDVGASARSGASAFHAELQNQRGALALAKGGLYAPYGGHDGDCGDYHGWLVGSPVSNPSAVTAWATPHGRAYLADRGHLGGVGGQVAVADVSTSPIINAAATYSTALGTYVVFKGAGAHCPPGQGEGGDLVALRLVPGAPPRVETAWCARVGGAGSPMVTTTDGHAEAIVWSVGAERDERLRGFDGDTGQVLFAGGGPGDALGTVRRFQTPILAGGRIFVAVDGGLKAFAR